MGITRFGYSNKDSQEIAVEIYQKYGIKIANVNYPDKGIEDFIETSVYFKPEDLVYRFRTDNEKYHVLVYKFQLYSFYAQAFMTEKYQILKNLGV